MKVQNTKLFLKAICGLLILGTSTIASANQCAAWGCISTIEDLYTNADSYIYIGTPLDEKIRNCTPVSGVYFSLDPTSGNAKEIYSSLLAAFTTGKKIQLRIKEGSAHCELSYVRLNSSY